MLLYLHVLCIYSSNYDLSTDTPALVSGASGKSLEILRFVSFDGTCDCCYVSHRVGCNDSTSCASAVMLRPKCHNISLRNKIYVAHY